MTIADAWEQNARDWIAWARTPEHDGFWEGTWPELRAVLPAPDGLAIEIGCGEGRVSRGLSGLGHAVIGIEQSTTLVRAAHDGSPPVCVVHADATRLPLGDAVANLVVACMSLHDVDDLHGTVAEATRVLRRGGALCVAMVHPFATAQDPATMHSCEYTFSEPYLSERRFVDRAEQDGLRMTLESMHRPLGAYLRAFADAGFALRAFREFGNKPIPWLLTMRLEKPS